MHSNQIIQLEKQMIPIKQSMEERGLNVNFSLLEDLIQKTLMSKNGVGNELISTLNLEQSINLNSSRDVGALLIEKLGVTPRRTKTGRYSTDKKFLIGLSNPLTDKIYYYRELEKTLSTLKAINRATDKTRGKIFCTYTDDCPSGRLYTKGYNLQGMPEIARRVVYPDEGCIFVLADYNSFELRILSALSHDTYFKQCWDSGLDLHRKVVSDMLGIPYETVTNKQRKLGKTLNFGLAYGQEPQGLARNLDISVDKARDLMQKYKKQIPEIEAFKLEAIRKARSTGFAETYYGRRRFLPNIKSENIAERKKSERQAVNTAIQGAAADIVKLSLINLHWSGFKIDTMLHDGILMTVPETDVRQSMSCIKSIMETSINDLRFTVTCKSGRSWDKCY